MSLPVVVVDVFLPGAVESHPSTGCRRRRTRPRDDACWGRRASEGST